MDAKEQALEYVKKLAMATVVSRDEVIAAYDSGVPAGSPGQVAVPPPPPIEKVGIADIMYYIGGAIVFLGIAIFVWQNWAILPVPARLLATLGGAIGAYVVGMLFSTQEKLIGPGNAFFLISALVMPLGLYVAFDAAGYNVGDQTTQILISGLLFIMFLCSFAVRRSAVFLLFSIMFGTWLCYAVTDYLVSQSIEISTWRFYGYRTLLSGACYILLGYAFAKGRFAAISGPLYAFGILGLLGSALALGGWEPEQYPLWELSYPLFVFGALFLSVYLKSKSFLVFGSIFLIAYIFKLTAEYFTEGFGWPLSLVVGGLAMIAVGYMSISLHKKYLKGTIN
jgi:hypothetical protein